MKQIDTRRPETDLSLSVNSVALGNALGQDHEATVDEQVTKAL